MFKLGKDKQPSTFIPVHEIVRTKLRVMFRSSHYDIRTVDECQKLMKATGNEARYELLRALHCVHYSAMIPELRHWLLQETVAEVTPDFADKILSELLPENEWNSIKA